MNNNKSIFGLLVLVFISLLLLHLSSVNQTRLLNELNTQPNIYQITTEQNSITSTYIKNAQNLDELMEYLSRFTADEKVTSVENITATSKELHTISIVNNEQPVMFMVVTEKVMKDGIKRQTHFVAYGMFEDEIAERFTAIGHTIISIEVLDGDWFMTSQVHQN